MKWRQLVSEYDYDEDTEMILEICLQFLQDYFGHEINVAQQILADFLEQHRTDYGEDMIHHELSYRIAAIMHYLIFLKGDRTNVGTWLAESGHHAAPREALEYFRENFYR